MKFVTEMKEHYITFIITLFQVKKVFKKYISYASDLFLKYLSFLINIKILYKLEKYRF